MTHLLKALITATGTALAAPVLAAASGDVAQQAARAFGDHCFSPYMTADRVAEHLALPGVRVDFYDTRPFSAAAPSPVTGRAATPGTDRRCELAFDGQHEDTAIEGATDGLAREGIRTPAEVPADFAALPTSSFVAARQLNPRRVAVVQVGTRPGPNGIETYVSVERLDPLAEPLQ